MNIHAMALWKLKPNKYQSKQSYCVPRAGSGGGNILQRKADAGLVLSSLVTSCRLNVGLKPPTCSAHTFFQPVGVPGLLLSDMSVELIFKDVCSSCGHTPPLTEFLLTDLLP